MTWKDYLDAGRVVEEEKSNSLLSSNRWPGDIPLAKKAFAVLVNRKVNVHPKGLFCVPPDDDPIQKASWRCFWKLQHTLQAVHLLISSPTAWIQKGTGGSVEEQEWRRVALYNVGD